MRTVLEISFPRHTKKKSGQLLRRALTEGCYGSAIRLSDSTRRIPKRGSGSGMKLKAKEIKEYREKQIKKQKGMCPLCRTPLAIEDATLDHCHETGHVRRALHRSCNSAEGRILIWAGRRSRGDSAIDFIRNLAKYWNKDYSNNPLHHTHGAVKRKRVRKRPARRK